MIFMIIFSLLFYRIKVSLDLALYISRGYDGLKLPKKCN